MSKNTTRRNTTNEVVNQTAEVKRQQEEEVVTSPAEEVAVETPVEEVTVAEETTVTEETEVAKETTVSAEEAPSEEEPVPEEEAPSEEESVSEEEAPSEEEPVPEEEAPSEEEPVSEEEAPSEEEPVSEEEAPSEEEPVSEEEASSEEEPVPEEEAPSEEAPVSKEEAPSEEAPVSKEKVPSEEAPVEKSPEEQTSEKQDEKPNKKSFLKKALKGVVAIAVAGGIFVTGLALSRCGSENPDNNETTDTTQETVATLPTIELEQFEDSVNGVIAGIAKNEADEAYSNMQVEKIGKEQVQKWVDKYGELPTQQAIAQFIAFASEIEMQRYIANEGLQYNPNAEDDYNDKLNAADAVYRAAQGKNPDGTLMTLPNYDDYKSSREAMKKLIMDSGDMDLYVWYVAKTDGYDLMMQQIRDTKKALEYKETVKLQLLESKGVADILELQLKKVSEGTLVVMDPVTYKYTSQYRDFILANWIYILAK